MQVVFKTQKFSLFHFRALCSTVHILPARLVADTRRNLPCAVTSDASSVLDWQTLFVIVLVDEALEVPRDNFSAGLVVLFEPMNDILSDLINLAAILIEEVNRVIQKIVDVIQPLFPGLSRDRDKDKT